MSKIIKKIRKKMRENNVNEPNEGGNWLRLGKKIDGGGVKSTGRHIVKLLEEPTKKKGEHYLTGRERDELHFLLEEDGEEKRWNITLYKLDDKGVPVKDENGNPTEHYLLKELEDVKVGDKFAMELKNKGKKNFVEVEYPLPNVNVNNND